MPAGTDLGDRVERQRLVVDHERVEHRRCHVQQVGVDHHLLEAGLQAALHPPGSVHHHVDTTADRPGDREHRLVGGLGIDGVGGAGVRAAERNAVATRQLATDDGRLPVLGRAERRRPRLHVDVAGEAAVDERAARAHDLGQHQADQRLGVLLRQGPGERDRCHRPGERERGDADRLVASRHLDDAVAHRNVERERRVGVDDAEQARLVVELGVGDAAGDPHHLDHVDVALSAQRVHVDHLVGERQQVERRLEMPDRAVDVDRFDGVPAGEVDRVQRLHQPQQVAEVVAVAGATTTVEIGHVGGAGHRAERQMVAADREMVGRVGGVQRELAGCGGDDRGDHLGIEAHHLVVVQRGAGAGEQRSRLGVEDLHPDLAQDSQRGLMDRLDLIGGRQLGRSVQEARLGERALFGERRALARVGAITTASTTPRCGFVSHDSPKLCCNSRYECSGTLTHPGADVTSCDRQPARPEWQHREVVLEPVVGEPGDPQCLPGRCRGAVRRGPR